MSMARLVALAGALLALAACSGGGGSTSPVTAAEWAKFRNDPANNGEGSGLVGATHTPVIRTPVPIYGGTTPAVEPIVSSPAIAGNGSIYIATEAGTLAAVGPPDLTTTRWTRVTCEACPGAAPTPAANPTPDLGGFVASAAVYTLNNVTSIMIGSVATATAPGRFYLFKDFNTPDPTCVTCFDPIDSPSNPPDEAAQIAAVSFVSSPVYATDSVGLNIAGIFVGATLRTTDGASIGKLYALNSDGSIKWQFPREPVRIAPITSSPALANQNVYFTSDDAKLYTISLNEPQTVPTPIDVGTLRDPDAPFATSPMVVNSILVTATADGRILAFNPGAQGQPILQWETSSPDGSGYVGSLASGPQALETPSPTPTISPTNIIGPTPTPTFIPQHLFAVTVSGKVSVLLADSGMAVNLPELSPIAPAPPILSSPMLSSDGFLVFGDNAGMLHAINTADGTEPPGWPLALSLLPIRSSPAITTTGIIYVGADDGMLHSVATQ